MNGISPGKTAAVYQCIRPIKLTWPLFPTRRPRTRAVARQRPGKRKYSREIEVTKTATGKTTVNMRAVTPNAGIEARRLPGVALERLVSVSFA
jgi:hypothetical protein